MEATDASTIKKVMNIITTHTHPHTHHTLTHTTHTHPHTHHTHTPSHTPHTHTHTGVH